MTGLIILVTNIHYLLTLASGTSIDLEELFEFLIYFVWHFDTLIKRRDMNTTHSLNICENHQRADRYNSKTVILND